MQTTLTQEAIRQAKAKVLGKPTVRARVRTTRERNAGMNSVEKRYAERLDALIKAGRVKRYRFEKINYQLANLTWYKPDFVIYLPDDYTEIHEVKVCRNNGKVIVEDDAQVKIKVFAEQFDEYTVVRAAWFPKGKRWKFDVYGGESVLID